MIKIAQNASNSHLSHFKHWSQVCIESILFSARVTISCACKSESVVESGRGCLSLRWCRLSRRGRDRERFPAGEGI